MFIRGCAAFACYVINTLFWFVPIFIGAIIKLVPIPLSQKLISRALDCCATSWISINSLIERVFHPVTIHIESLPVLSTKEWYMVIANHQSWVDILVLQRVLNKKIPFLKFFLKKELIYVPVLGVVWWALDFPFMRRHSMAALKKNPKLKGQDIIATQKACSKFKHNPVSIMNFVEGTRFTAIKHQKQNSGYNYLLRPRAGGLAFALAAMGDQIKTLVNVTIYYPNKTPSFWEYISGQVTDVYVDVSVSEITTEMRGDYTSDREFKSAFQQRLNIIWQEKDDVMVELASKAKDNSAC